MLIKSGLDHKSRWNLDDFEADDENLAIENHVDVPTHVANFLKTQAVSHCLHPKLAPIARDIPKELIGTITVTQKTTVTPAQFTEFDGTDHAPEPETHTISYKVGVFKVKYAALLELPAIDVELCGAFAKHVVPHLNVSTIYSPGQVYGDSSICAMYCNVDSSIKTIPTAEPPSHLQGVTAAILSAAQRLGKHMSAVVVHADGPAGHEVIQQLYVTMVQDIFLKNLGLSRTITQPDVSALYL